MLVIRVDIIFSVHATCITTLIAMWGCLRVCVCVCVCVLSAAFVYH